ncbi:hypothetical protein GWI33_002600 [Rhynchophorus ferrugineus]|nr:hypothetical protein GWI33_002600 [Rhynchophorus ferrugineus]
MKSLLIFVLGCLGCGLVDANIPSYIKLCKRTDPNVSQCLRESIEYLRPKLKEGIPELNVPSLEPLPLNEIRLNSGPNQARINANISNLLVHGPTTFKINDLKADLKRTRFLTQFTIPTLYFEGNYELDMNVLFIKYQGRGPINGTFTNYVFNCLMKADKTGKSQLFLGNLFSDNGEVLARASQDLIEQNTDVLIDEIKPTLEQGLAEKFTKIANSIMDRYPYDELFPQ